MAERRAIRGTSSYEDIMGYCRAVAVGSSVYVAGTAPIPPDGSPPPEGSYEQTRLCLEIVRRALEQAGAGLEHVVRTRVYITGPEHFEGMAKAHGEAFADVRPVNTTVVTSLMDPAWTVELDVDAVLE